MQYDKTLIGDIEGLHIAKYDKYWGEHSYFVEKDGDRIKLEQGARYMLPMIKNLENWMLEDEKSNN
jgi:hypothetical protein